MGLNQPAASASGAVCRLPRRPDVVTEIRPIKGFSLHSSMPLAPALLSLRIGQRVGLSRPAGTALARNRVEVDAGNLDLIRRREPLRQPFGHAPVHDHQGDVAPGGRIAQAQPHQ